MGTKNRADPGGDRHRKCSPEGDAQCAGSNARPSHTRGDSRQAGTLTDDFVDRFAIVGPPGRCIERLRSLEELGLDRVAISGGMRGAAADDIAVAKDLVARHVLPAIH